jgi:autophagy-related protein 13
MLDETEVLSDDLQEWRRPDLSDEPPPPLVIEVYVDTSHLTQNQSLVIVDDVGRRSDVAEFVAAESSPKSNRAGGRYYEVLLERWTIELGDMGRYKASQLNDQLPNVYKKGVLLFRSLYTYARFLPAWKLHKRLSRQPSNAQPLKLRFRIRQGRSTTTRLSQDALHTPLCPSDLNNNTPIAEHHNFAPLLCSAGPLTISIDYRTNVDFTVADAEALLSSRFAGLDAGLARHPVGGRSLPGGHHHSATQEDSSSSLGPTGGTGRPTARVAGGGAYGSLGTFHATGKRESPVSALRNRVVSGDSDTAPSPERRVTSQLISTSSAGGVDFLKNPPFKAGSVASSPRTYGASPSPSTSAPRPSPLTGASSHSKRLSLNTLPQQALRNPAGITQDTAIASSGSTSPKPAPVHRYSSSFAGRKRWTSTSRSSRAGESATSSGRGSSSSKEKSGQLPSEQASGTPGSSGSARTDEDDIAAFISTVERAKDLKAFSARKPAAHNNVINLSRFKNMSLASSELADEMSSSSLVQTSVTPPSRRLSNVPGLSISSSPSRMQPHVPHVRSRLSTQSIAEEISSEKGRKPEREVEEEDEEVDEDDSDDEEPFIFQQDNI